MTGQITNKIKNNQKLVTLDLLSFYDGSNIESLDIKDGLFRGLILKESDYKHWISNLDFSGFTNKNVAVWCSEDAILAPWAFMMLATELSPFARSIHFCSPEACSLELMKRNIEDFDWSIYQDKFVMIKGCSKIKVPNEIYALVASKLVPFAKKIMYGEACSNVPIWKK